MAALSLYSLWESFHDRAGDPGEGKTTMVLQIIAADKSKGGSITIIGQ